MADEELLASAREVSGSAPAMPAAPSSNKSSDDLLADAARETVGGQASLIRNNLINAQGKNPAAESKVQQLATATGLPSDTVRAQPDAAQTRATLSTTNADTLVQQYPHLAQFMSHPDNAAQVHPFVPAMATTEEAVKAMPTATPAQTPAGESLIDQIAGTPAEIAKGLGGSFNKAAAALNLAAGGVPTIYDKLASVFSGHDSTAAADWWFRNMVAPAVERQQQFDTPANAGFVSKAANMSGNLLGMMSQIVLTGGEATAVPAAATTGEVVGAAVTNATKSMAFPAVTSAVDAGRRVYEATGDPHQALAAAQEEYLSSTAMGLIPLAAPGGVVKRSLTGFLSGVTTGEASRQAANAVMPASMQQPFDPEQVILSGLSGLMLGGVMGPRGNLSHVEALNRVYDDTVKAQQSEADLKNLHYLGAVSEANPLRENNPEAFKQFVQTMADDHNLSDVYVNAHDLDNALKGNVVEGQAFTQKMPEVEAQIAEQLALNGDVRIPLADYATHIAGKPLDEALLPHLKVSPEGMTYSEGQKYFQNATAEMQAQATKISAEQNLTEQQKADQQEVHNAILDQLNTANHFPSEVNKTYAALAAAGYGARAKSSGVSARELWAKYPLNIEGGTVGADIAADYIKEKDLANGISTGYNQSLGGKNGQADVGSATGAGAQGQKQELHTTVAGKPAPEGWAGATRATRNGSPAIFYRGAESKLAAGHFERGSLGFASGKPSSGLGVFLTSHEAEAKSYHQNVEKFYVDTRNPKIIKAEDLPSFDSIEEAHAYREKLRAQGYDSIVITAKHLGKIETHVVTFEPSQLIHTEAQNANEQSGQNEPRSSGTGRSLSQSGSATPSGQPEQPRVGLAGEPISPERTTVNIGLNVNDGSKITEAQAKAALEKVGVAIRESAVHASTTEPTLVAHLSRALTPEEAHQVSVELKQDAIAQHTGTEGKLYGPEAAKWGDFNPDFFLNMEGKPLSAKPGEVSVQGIHFSQAIRSVLKGSFYGKGMKGAEARRLQNSEDPRIKQRISFYVNEGHGVTPETGVGANRHYVTLKNLYDLRTDPLNLATHDSNALESAILDAGFDGYYVKNWRQNQGAAVLLGDAAKEVKVDSTEGSNVYHLTSAMDAAAVKEFGRHLDQLPDAQRIHVILNHPEHDTFAKRILSEGTKPVSFEEDMTHQQAVLDRVAKAKGYASIDEFASKSPVEFYHYAEAWRGHHTLFQQNQDARIRQLLDEHKAEPDYTREDAVKDALKEQRTLYQGQQKAPIFFSQLAKSINEAPEKVFGKGENVANWTDANASKLGIKKDEVEATGVKDWLKLQGKVSKADVQNFLGQNGVQVREVTLGEPVELDKNDARRFGATSTAAAGTTKFASYQLPGGENYKELLLTLPEKQNTNLVRVKQLQDEYDDLLVRATTIDSLPEQSRNLRNLETQITLAKKEGAAPSFSSAHFDQKNILAHVRFNERTDAEGHKVLFLEELQSDWGQKGKKEGFAAENKDAAEKAFNDYSKELADKYGLNPSQNLAMYAHMKGMSDAEVSKYEQLQHEWVSTKNGVPSAPFVTDTKAWTALALKRMIRYAAEKGFDKVAWTTGEQQAARYDLSKHVQEIDARPNGDGTYDIELTMPDGSTHNMRMLTASGLEENIGKDLTKKIVDDGAKWAEANKAYRAALKETGVPEAKLDELKTAVDAVDMNYSGLDLKVGGEGMKGYYDQIVPQVANDVLKKLGGGKVEDVGISAPVATIETKQRRDGKWITLIDGEGYGPVAATEEAALAAAKSLRKTANQQGFTITPEMRDKVVQQGQPLFQDARASYVPDTSTLHLLKDADLSSFTHELGHHFLEITDHLADSSPEMRHDMDTVLNWFGKTSDEWRGMTFDQREPFHEKFAEGFEHYMMEGNAPSLELRPVFARVRTWMLSVYKSLQGLFAARPQAEQLTPEVRQVFDRMLATEEAIKQAEAVKNYEPLFKTAKEAGMSEQAYQDYISLGERATSNAVTDMERKSMRDMQWLSGAKSKMLKSMQKEANGKREAIRAEVTKEVESTPIEQAHKHLTEGEVKLSRDALKEMHVSDVDIAKLKGMTATDGIHPDMAADSLGLQSGDALVTGLLNREDPTHAIDGLTDQRMLERNGELSDPQAIERAANQAISNEARARFMATGLKVLTKSPISASALAKAAKAVAEDSISKKKVKELHPAMYDIQEAKANKEALKAAPKDPQGAIKAQREALLNNRMSRAANDAIDDIRKGSDYLKRFSKDSVRQKIDVDIRDQIDDLLSRFDLRQNVTTTPTRAQLSLRDWVKSQEDAGYTPMVTPDMADPAIKMHYKEMTVEQFRGLTDTVKALEHIGKERNYATIAGVRTNVDEYVRGKLAPKILERGIKFTPEQLVERPEDRHTNQIAIAFDHFNSWRRMAAAELMPQSHKANFYDRHEILGPFNESITSRVIEANYSKVRMLKGLSDDFQAQAKALGREWQDSMRDTVKNDKLVDPDTGKLLSMTRGRMIGLAIHVGNESNFHKMTAGWNFKGEDVWAFLHNNMAAKDWQATQAVWDLYEKHWPDVEAMNHRLGNTSPDKIEARPFKTNFGEQRGGYAAIKYDPLRSKRGEREAAGAAVNPSEGLFGHNYFRPDTTTNGSLNSRMDNYTDRVDLDFHGIPQRLQETIHDLAYREALIDANKIIEHPEFRKAVRSVHGREAYKSLQDWVGNLANSNTQDNQIGAIKKFLSYTRTGMVMNAIAFRASTVIKHGGSAAFKSAGYFAGGGEQFFARRMAAMGTNYTAEIEGARNKFGEIFSRLLQQDRDFKQTSTSMFEPESIQSKGERFGHAMVAWSDMMTAVPTAWAAYDRAISVGIPETQGGTGLPMTEAQSVDYANRIVREAHGSYTEAGRSLVLSSKSESMKMFTTLYSFMNNAYGQQLDGFDKLRTAGISNAPVLARAFMSLIVPALVAEWTRENFPKEETVEGWAKWTGKAIADECAATVPFVRDAVSMYEGFSGAGQVAAEAWIASLVTSAKDVVTGTGKPIRDFANTAGMWLHIPGLGQLGSSAQYAEDVKEGKKTPQSQAELVKGVIVGH